MSEATGTARVKRGMAEMLKGGTIMDVVNVEQAKIAEDAGAALEHFSHSALYACCASCFRHDV